MEEYDSLCTGLATKRRATAKKPVVSAGNGRKNSTLGAASKAKKEEWKCALEWTSTGMDGSVSNWYDSSKVKEAILKKKEEREKIAKQSAFLKSDWGVLKRGFLLD